MRFLPKWSKLCATKARRTAFIESAKTYMTLYGFQGLDIDWEYPGAPERGGDKWKDTHNFVLLVKEMHDAFNGQFGTALPSDQSNQI